MSQFFYVHEQNPQIRLINQATRVVNQGGVIVYPTDSGYALGCLLGEKDAMARIVRIRQIENDHNFSLMVRDQSELASYAMVDNQSYRVLKYNTPGPYTFIFKASKEVPKRLQIPKKKTIGIRVPDNIIALALLDALDAPLMSTSLILPGEEFTESDPEHIRDVLEHQVDVIIHGGYLGERPTTVIDLSEGNIDILREGCGDVSQFV